jgi:DNA-binding NtrC family response regulator
MSNKSKILVADDEKLVRWSIAQALTKEGYEVVMAASGRETVDLASQEVFDLIITDLKMSDVDGLEVLKNLRQVQVNSKVIVITAYATESLARDSLEMGASLFISKPFDLNYMKEVVNRILGATAIENIVWA